jgi:DNA-binding transcriptional LysR family regulator
MPLTVEDRSNTKGWSVLPKKICPEGERRNMELRHLRYFVAVAEESSLGRAARRLHVSQAASSKQISELEDELGLQLFARSSRGVQLTEAGRVFLIGGRRALMAVNLAAERAQEAAKALTDPLSKR